MIDFRKVKCPKCGRIKLTRSITLLKCDACNFKSNVKNFIEYMGVQNDSTTSNKES